MPVTIARVLGAGLVLIGVAGRDGWAADTLTRCWTPVGLPMGAAVVLRTTGEPTARLNFIAAAPAPVNSSTAAGSAIPANEPVELTGGEGRLLLASGSLELVAGDARYLVTTSSAAAGLSLAPTASIPITTPVAIADGKLPTGTPAPVVFGTGVPAVLTAPAKLTPITPDGDAAQLEVGALPITRGGRTFQVEFKAVGVTRAQLEVEPFQACFVMPATGSASDSNGLARAFVTLTSAGDGHAVLAVAVPDELTPYRYPWERLSLRVLAPTVGLMTNAESVYIASPPYGFIIAVLVVVGLLVAVAWLMPPGSAGTDLLARLSSFATGLDGDYSLSQLQMYLWTVLVLIGMVYVLCMSGNLLNISQQVLVLLGLAGLGSISSRLISNTGTTPATGKGFWGMLMVGGKPDLLRLQLFVFTLAIWLYVAVRLFYEQKFPELDANVLLLMGISNSLYIGAKWASTDTTSNIGKLSIDRETLRETEANAQGLVTQRKAELAALSDPADETKPIAGKGADHAAAKTALTDAQTALDDLTRRHTAAETAFKAELDRLGKT